MAEFRMPSLGADMDEGTLLEWLVRPGSLVHKGDIVAVVDTSKAAIEVECFDDGVVEELRVPPGTRVPVGTVLATIGSGEAATPGGAVEGPAAPARKAAPAEPARPAEDAGLATPPVRHLAHRYRIDLATVRGTGPGGRVTHDDLRRTIAEQPVQPAPTERPTPTERPGGGQTRISPRARRLAADLGVDLAAVSGSGPGGAIEAADVRRAATATPQTGGKGRGRAEAMRAAIAALMSRSKKEVPHYYLTETIELGAAMTWLHDRNRALPVPERLVPAALLLKASAVAARSVPDVNGFWRDGGFTPGGAVHLGVAVYLRGGGLVAPAIHNADELPLAELMALLRDLVARARAGRLRRAELADPTITVSNLGDQGVESIIGVIHPPQVALVGFGRVTERPWATGGLLGVRPVVTASLAGDHRASDGATGARYLRAVARLLRRPEQL